MTSSNDNVTTNVPFEDAFNGAVVIEQVSRSEVATGESRIVVNEADSEGWFLNTLRDSAFIYRNMLVASLFINLITVVLAMMLMTAFDTLSSGGSDIVWSLAVGAFIGSVYVAVLKLVRLHFLDIACESADPNVSHFFSSAVFSRFMDIPFAILSLVFIAYIGGLFVVPLLVACVLFTGFIFVFHAKKPKAYLSVISGFLFAFSVIVVLVYGIKMIHSGGLTIGVFAAIVLLYWYCIAAFLKVPMLIEAYNKAKTAYENGEKTLKLSLEYDGVVRQSEPSTKMIGWIVSSMLLVAIIWASLVDIDERVLGVGSVMPSEQIVKVQTVEGGTIEKFFVEEGEFVEANQTIAKLNIGTAAARATENRIKLYEQMAKAGRLNAENDSKEFVPSAELIKGIPHSVKREQALYLKAIQTYLASLEVAKTQLKLAGQNETKIKDANAKISQVRSSFKASIAKELSVVNNEIGKLKNNQKILDEKVANSTIYSPIKGVIQKIYPEEIGDAVLPSSVVVDIEPIYDSFFVEAKVSASDILFVKPSQDSSVSVGNHAFKGKVVFVSPDMGKNNKNEKFYMVKIKADKPADENKLSGEARIKISTGKQSILGHILRPIFKK